MRRGYWGAVREAENFEGSQQIAISVGQVATQWTTIGDAGQRHCPQLVA
jgi:hypothetical protein